MKKSEKLLSMIEEVDGAYYYDIDEILADPDIDEGFKDLIRRGKDFANWATSKLSQMKAGLAQEKQETKEMLKTFFALLKKKLRLDKPPPPSNDEVQAAIAQLKDVAKVGLVATVLMGPLPGDEPLLIGLELLAKKFGMSFFPSALKGII